MSSLLSLLHATAEWQAGLPPDCLASVRYLDAISLSIDRGDCVVVRHDDPAGARILLAALAGSPVALQARGWRGERQVFSGLRVRRAAIRSGVLPWILSGWRSAAERPSSVSHPRRAVAEPAVARPPAMSPLVHLFRASREGDVSTIEGGYWRRWARDERERGHAVVLVVGAGMLPQPGGSAVRELRLRDGRLGP